MEMRDLDALAREVRQAAEEIGLSSLRKIAAHVGVDHTLILGIVTYKRRPTPETVTKLSEALGRDRVRWLRLAGYSVVPSEVLHDRVKDPSAQPYGARRMVTLDISQLERRLRESGKLTQEAIDAVVSIIEATAPQAESEDGGGEEARP